MARWIIEGGHPLDGQVEVQGSVEIGLFVQALSLMAQGTMLIEGLPHCEEAQRMETLLLQLGMESTYTKSRVQLYGTPQRAEIPYGLLRESTALLWPIIPLLLRCGEVRFAISPYDPRPAEVWSFFFEGLRKMGVSLSHEMGYLRLKAQQLQAADLTALPAHPFSATLFLLAALGAKGTTALRFPQDDLLIEKIAILKSMGAELTYQNDHLLVQGHPPTQHTLPLQAIDIVLPADRFEASFFLFSAALLQGKITLQGRRFWGLQSMIDVFVQVGASLQRETNKISLSCPPLLAPVRPPPEELPTAIRSVWWAWLLLTQQGLDFPRQALPASHMLSELRKLGVALHTSPSGLCLQQRYARHSADITARHGHEELGLLLAALSTQGRTLLEENSFSAYLPHLSTHLKQLGAKLQTNG